MSSLEIKEVINHQDWQGFSQIKENIYLPLTHDREGSWEETRHLRSLGQLDQHRKATAFIAIRDQEIVGRIVAITDTRHQPVHEGFFGFFECQKDAEATQKLLQAAGQKLQNWGKSEMIGPISASTNEKVGIMIEGFETLPHPLLAYNPPYYRELLEGNGLKKAMGLLSYLWQDDLVFPDRFALLAENALAKYKVNLHYPAGGKVNIEAPLLQEVYNESLSGNWGFVPITLSEAKEVLLGYRFSPNPDFLFRLDIQGEPAGLCLMQPNNRLRLKRTDPQIRVAVLGLKPQFRKKGLSSLLILKIIDFLQDQGYQLAELSLIMENNQTVRGLVEETLKCPVLHRYQVYRTSLSL